MTSVQQVSSMRICSAEDHLLSAFNSSVIISFALQCKTAEYINETLKYIMRYEVGASHIDEDERYLSSSPSDDSSSEQSARFNSTRAYIYNFAFPDVMG